MASSIREIEVEPADEYVEGDYLDDEVPEQLKDDCLVQYFRCRFEYREALKSTYDDSQRGTIDRRTSSSSDNYRQTVWRRHAIDKREDNAADLNSRIWKLIHSGKIKYRSDGLRRIAFEKKILSALRSWTRPNEPPLPRLLRDLKNADDAAAAAAQFKNPLAKLIEKLTHKSRPEELKVRRPILEPLEVIHNGRDFNCPEDSYGISVQKITLRQSDPFCPSSYMSYSTDKYSPFNVIIASDTNPLTEKCEPNTIRYFHFPSNNMHWIEEAIARYYGEETPGEFNYRKHPMYREKSSNLLCRQFWTGLQQGGVHASMKSASSEIFWRQLNKLGFIDHQTTGFEVTALKYLNISAECELLRDAHSIIEELRMMKNIFTQQLLVVEQFSEYLQILKVREKSKRVKRNAGPDENDESSSDISMPGGRAVPTAVAESSIPESTLVFAQDIHRLVSDRRSELQELEQNTAYQADEASSLFLPEFHGS
ncbi:hypothetical protein IFR05_001241 [Cadophora sp. M221]|nr:hypothetical protein IFR05_001241 [Cadophora sp. M221]